MQKERKKLSFIQKVYLDNLDRIREELQVGITNSTFTRALNKVGVHSSNFGTSVTLIVDDELVMETINPVLIVPTRNHRNSNISCIIKEKEHERYRLGKPTIISADKKFIITTKTAGLEIFVMQLTEDFRNDMIRTSFLNNNPW